VRDEKSFWGGRVVEIELEAPGRGAAPAFAPAPMTEPDESDISEDDTMPVPGAPIERPVLAMAEAAEAAEAADAEPRKGGAPKGAMDPGAFSTAEASLTELLSAAGFCVESRRRQGHGDEMLFDLRGAAAEPLRASGGEGLSGLEVLGGRTASKRRGGPVSPRLDAEG